MAETIDATPAATPVTERDVSSSLTITQVMYVLHALAPFTMWTLAVVAMIIGLVKRDEVRGTWLDSHYAWMSRTFWWGILLAIAAWTIFWVLGLLTLGIGMAVLWVLPVAVVIWYLYRVIKGWLALNDRKAIG